jgi:hypothetical protein
MKKLFFMFVVLSGFGCNDPESVIALFGESFDYVNAEESVGESETKSSVEIDSDAHFVSGLDTDTGVYTEDSLENDVDGGVDSGIIIESGRESQDEDGNANNEDSVVDDGGIIDTDTNQMIGEFDFDADTEITDTNLEPLMAYIGDCYEGNIWIHDQEDMQENSELECVIGDLNISYTTELVAVDLPNLVRVYGNFTITYNQSLESIDVPELAYVQGPLLVTMNEFLPTCEGYALVVSAREREGLASGSLVSGNAMDGCTQPTECYQWSVTVSTQEDMDKFSMVRCFKKTLYVETDVLEEVAFPALSRLGSKLIIQNSHSLQSIDFPALKYARGIQIVDNSNLSTCGIISVISDAEEREEDGGYLGDITIDNNLDDGCYY